MLKRSSSDFETVGSLTSSKVGPGLPGGNAVQTILTVPHDGLSSSVLPLQATGGTLSTLKELFLFLMDLSASSSKL